MRIEGPRAADTVKKSGKARKAGESGGVFGSFLEADAEGAAETASAPMAAGIGSLLAAQSVEDPVEKKSKKRMYERAERVLDGLEDVHKGLLGGTLSTVQMERMANTLAERREKIMDPRLAAILDEVDLRAQVELAKMEMAKEKL